MQKQAAGKCVTGSLRCFFMHGTFSTLLISGNGSILQNFSILHSNRPKYKIFIEDMQQHNLSLIDSLKESGHHPAIPG
ncbi:MAG: hypothetical protein GWN62_13095 [Aliifodinibius sp.]|nr:hypothetical protein [Fodinibius sp.]